MEKNNEKKFYNVKSGYLADGLSFLGFRYQKMGYGKETIYTFEDTERFRDILERILGMKREIDNCKQ